MNFRFAKPLFVALTLLAMSVSITAVVDCPRTLASDGPYVDGWPQVDRWFGSRQLAIILPSNDTLPIVKPGQATSMKLFWYSEWFEPGRESDFVVRIRRMDKGMNDAVISKTTHADGSNLGASTVLTRIEFKSEGCWEISAIYGDASLSIVVETTTDKIVRNAT